LEQSSVNKFFVAVIDDDAALCLSLADLMKSSGYHVEQFSSAEMFLMSPSLLSFDCIIADVYMPGKSGLKLVRELHEKGIMTPVILITGQPEKQLDMDAVSTGAECLLRKPFEMGTLLAHVERSIHG
jgi:FixJ family two-component response regulator